MICTVPVHCFDEIKLFRNRFVIFQEIKTQRGKIFKTGVPVDESCFSFCAQANDEQCIHLTIGSIVQVGGKKGLVRWIGEEGNIVFQPLDKQTKVKENLNLL